MSESNEPPLSIMDGVKRLSPTGISIIIAGGGVGGLMTALEAWRQGHDVQVFEKNLSLDTIGDTFGILPPAWVTLRFFPAMKEQFVRDTYDAEFSLWHYKGHKVVHLGEADWNYPGSVHPAKDIRVPWIYHRPRIARMLTTQCERLGIPIKYGSTVVAYSESSQKATITVQSAEGETIAGADIVVAADGVGTKSHSHITGHQVRAKSSGYANYRGCIPTELLKPQLCPQVFEKFFSSPRPEFRIYMTSSDGHGNIVLTKDFFCYALTYKENERKSKESWSASVSADAIVDTFSDWDPDILEILRLIPPNSAVDWTLRWRDPQPEWASRGGRVIQLGDSAHSFLPTSGNGATQACEDALSLATCLRIAGKGREHIATKVHAKLRFERVSTIQKFGFTTRQALHNVDLEFAQDHPEVIGQAMHMPEWIWGHDPVKYAEENYERAERHILDGAPFQNSNMPPGYVYEPWTMESEKEKEKLSKQSDMLTTGNGV
ncbi:FAD/NAD(P)-binding domain-containing protein [Annulohypoxylon nitens]|nr:FAD/NAD(P)-binding domain-containing protein [Annulohypoxylon nitens]